MADWPPLLASEKAERDLLAFGPWEKAFPYFFTVEHRDRVGELAPCHPSALQRRLIDAIDQAAICELTYLVGIAKDGGEVYIADLLERLHGRSPEDAYRGGAFSPFEIGLKLNVLKSRRGGSSTFFLLAGLRACLSLPGYQAITWAEIQTSTSRIFRLQRTAAENWRDDIHLSKNEVGLARTGGATQKFINGSEHQARTCGSSTRGDKFDFLHLSEYAHYKEMDDVAQSVMVARPHAWIIRESTANGFENHFAADWQQGLKPAKVVQARAEEDFAALERWNGQYNIFFAWWEDPGLSMPVSKKEAEHILADLDVYEQDLMDHMGGTLTAGQIKFRRQKIREYESVPSELEGMLPEQFFDQEYPWCPEAAFQATSRSVFDGAHITAQRRHAPKKKKFLILDWETDPRLSGLGPLTIYEPPEPGEAYVIPADIAQGVGWDYSEASVFKRTDDTQLIEVANIHSNRITPAAFAFLVSTVAYMYNDAFIVGEHQGVGTAFTDALLNALGYSNIYMRAQNTIEALHTTNQGALKPGVWWRTGTKEAAISRLQSALRDACLNDAVVIRSEHGLAQLKQYQFDGKRYGAPRGYNDDFVSMLMLLMVGKDSMPPLGEAPNMVKRSLNITEESLGGGQTPLEQFWSDLLGRCDRVARRNMRSRAIGMAEPFARR